MALDASTLSDQSNGLSAHGRRDARYLGREGLSPSGSDSDGSEAGSTLNLSRYATNASATMNGKQRAEPDGFDERRPERHDTVMAASTAPHKDAAQAPSALATTSLFGQSPFGAPVTSSPVAMSAMSWAQQGAKQRSSSVGFGGTSDPALPASAAGQSRPERPGYTRTPSNAYAPARRPSQYPGASHRHRSISSRPIRLSADAEYRAQKKAYAQRIQRDNFENEALLNVDYPPNMGFSSGTEDEEESPATGEYLESDPYDQEAMLYYGNEDTSPSQEDLKNPANRERLEWHSMLANVLTGDVVRQEKKRLTGGNELQGDNTLNAEIWAGIRAKVCGRPLPAQKHMLDDQRNKVPTWVEEIVSFEIRGEAEAGKSARQQVEHIVGIIERCERLYPTRSALKTAHPRTASEEYKMSCDAVVAWHNTTALINTELEILRSWVGNDELDFHKPKVHGPGVSKQLTDDAPFIDRILKEDGLKSLQPDRRTKEDGKSLPVERQGILQTVMAVIEKAKATLITNAGLFSNKHLPPYIEELLTLINFPSRLLQEIIRVRLQYASNIRDPEKQNLMMAEQMISQFQILLTLAVKVKLDYLQQAAPEPGWDLPPCIDEDFDSVVLQALRFYLKMLGWKLSANRNSFKEAEILEQEWEFANALCSHLEGGDVEAAEHFSSLTSLSLSRLTTYFKEELRRRPNEVAGPEMDRRYKSILDSVRVRQRKLFRFSRLLTQTFENTTEYSMSQPQHLLDEMYDNLLITGHILITPTAQADDNVLVFASPTLVNRSLDIKALIGTCYRSDDGTEDTTTPYLLFMHPENAFPWEGLIQDVDIKVPNFHLKPGKLRIVAEGTQQLSSARAAFAQTIGIELDIVSPQKANFPRVDSKLQKIKRKAYELSNTIMNSVENIRKQLVGLECQELIQNCFAFATEFGQRSVLYMDYNRRQLNNLKLTRLALDWISFICDDCIASDRKTFRWAVVALEFAMIMTRGQNILSISDEEYAQLRTKVSGCMALLISHFDIMGARSTVAAQAEKQRNMDAAGGRSKLDISKMKDDEESAHMVREQWMQQLAELDELRKSKEAERQALGHVLEDSNEADRSLTFLSSSATNVTLRWQQGQFIGGGTFGSVYVGHNLDSGQLMAVKEIRLQDPQLIPSIAAQIREEMGVLQILEHPNMVKYHGIEVHRDKVFIFMEYCAGGSLAGLLEHGRIEDESFILVYTLQMLEGLAYLHESGVVHRDIKPENILLDHNGVIKFVDFGAARLIAQQTGRTLAHPEHPPGAVPRQGGGRQHSMTGTPMYMSPEVINPDNVHSKGRLGRPGAVDVWSMGCVVLEMSTGRRPWASLDNEWAIMYNIAQGNPPQLPSREQMSDLGIDFLKRCFERDPSKRASAAELLQHEWIMGLRNQLSLEPQTPSDNGSNSGGSMSSTSTELTTPSATMALSQTGAGEPDPVDPAEVAAKTVP